MTETETITQILEFLGSCEAEKAVLAGGELAYSPDFEEYNTFRIEKNAVSLLVMDHGWMKINPRTDMNSAAFLTKALHDYLHDRLDETETCRSEKIIYIKLHDMIIDVQKRFATLEMPIIYEAIQEVAQQINASQKWFKK